jgi:DnaJ-class molecular chaperone
MLGRHVDYYRVLGVTPDAGVHEIRRAYRRLARERHPDVDPRDAADHEFAALAQAYEVLRDPATRARYDHQLARRRSVRGEEHRPSRGSPVQRGPLGERTRSAILELTGHEARQVATAPLTLIDRFGLVITLPAGTRDGDRLRFRGVGVDGWGELVLTVAVTDGPGQAPDISCW